MSKERNQVLDEFDGYPLYWDRPIDFQEACEILLSVRHVRDTKICHSVPQNFRGEGTFVIDLHNFTNRHDVALDGLGVWGKPTGRTRFYALSPTTGKPVRVDDGKGKLQPGLMYEYKCMAKRYEHPQIIDSGSRFIKKIFTAVLPPDVSSAVALAIVCYEWIGDPIDFEVSTIAHPRRNPSMAPLDGSRSWEAASFAAAGVDADQGVSMCDQHFDNCPLYAIGAVDFGAAASIVLGGTIIDPSRICTRVPQGYRSAGTFVIDIRSFVADAELRRDGNGAWGKPAGHSRYYKIDNATGDAIRVDKGHKLIEGSDYDVQILSKRYEHTAVGGRFVRKIYTGRSKAGGRSASSCCNLAMITYYWKGDPEYFEATPQRRVRAVDRAIKLTSVGIDMSNEDGGHDTTSTSNDPLFNIRPAQIRVINNRNESPPTTTHVTDSEFRTPRQPPVNTTSDRIMIGTSSTSPRIIRKRVYPTTIPTTTTTIRNTNVDYETANLRRIVYEKEYENQERLSTILDRAESFIDRLERAGDFLPEQIWIASQSTTTNGGANNLIVNDNDHYVQEDDGSGGGGAVSAGTYNPRCI